MQGFRMMALLKNDTLKIKKPFKTAAYVF